MIITCTITGATHTPSMSEHLPVTPEEIVEPALAAADTGAAIVHLHARDPETGQPDQTAAAFEPVVREIETRSDVIMNATTGGSSYMKVAERIEPACDTGPGGP